ncbi:MAG: histidine phosphatase family protein [Emergencia sp.]|nr:histidine phosphatase family protein [Emergencia sp.]
MNSRIYFIRHGITEGNQRKWFYGAADIPLAQEGFCELESLTARGIYPELPEDADCYTTGLLRTEQTFELIFGNRQRKVIEALQEMRFGKYECHSYEELEGDPEFSAWCWDRSGDAPLSGGETRNAFSARIGEGLKELLGYHRLKELAHRHDGKDAVSVIVCHGGVISAVMQEMFPGEKGNMWDWMPQPGFGYCVEFEDGEPAAFVKLADTAAETSDSSQPGKQKALQKN